MKTKLIFKTLAAALLMPAMLLTTACSNDDDAINNTENTPQKYYEIPVTLNVTRQGDNATTRATYNGETRKLEFSTGDKLQVRGEHGSAGYFAGALDWVSEGTFSGTILCQNAYTGTADALLSSASFAQGTLMPAGHEAYGYLDYYEYGSPTSTMSPNTVASTDPENVVHPLAKAEAVAQLSLERADSYSDGFALKPQNAVVCCNIYGLPASTEVTVAYGDIGTTYSVTTDASGTATFAIAIQAYGMSEYVGSLTVNGNNIDLGGAELTAGHVYNATKFAAPITLDPAEIGNVYLYGSEEDKSSTVGFITVAIDGNSNDYQSYFFAQDYGNFLALNNGATMTFSTSVGKIKKIEINHNGMGYWYDADGWGTAGNYEEYGGGTFTWQGTPAASVTLSGVEPALGSIQEITSLVFTLE